MDKEKLQIVNESNDKGYFTIVPNIVLDTYTSAERHVYIQMKKICGEGGSCWSSQTSLSFICDMSINTLKEALKGLIEKEAIALIGKKSVFTKGGLQLVNEYKICDIWKKNVDYYQSLRGMSKTDTPKRGIKSMAKGVSK